MDGISEQWLKILSSGIPCGAGRQIDSNLEKSAASVFWMKIQHNYSKYLTNYTASRPRDSNLYES
jgi:hypothetical protein